jgi:hypothetical protein
MPLDELRLFRLDESDDRRADQQVRSPYRPVERIPSMAADTYRLAYCPFCPQLGDVEIWRVRAESGRTIVVHRDGCGREYVFPGPWYHRTDAADFDMPLHGVL